MKSASRRLLSKLCRVLLLAWIPIIGMAQKPPKPHFYEFKHAFNDPRQYQHPDRMDTVEYSKIRIYHFKDRHGHGLPSSEFMHGRLRHMRRVPNKEVYVLTRQDEIDLVPILSRPIDYDEEKYLCMFVPHHAIVFFDRWGRVLSYIEICLTCRVGGPTHSWLYFDRGIVGALEDFMRRCNFEH